TNVGQASTGVGNWSDDVIASPNAVAGDGDDILLKRFPHTGALGPQQSYPQPQSQTFLLPPGMKGHYHLFVVADSLHAVFENGTLANNAGGATQPLDVTPTPYSDLVVSWLNADASAQSGRPLTVTWTIKNQGIGATDTDSWSDSVSLATDAAGSNLLP